MSCYPNCSAIPPIINPPVNYVLPPAPMIPEVYFPSAPVTLPNLNYLFPSFSIINGNVGPVISSNQNNCGCNGNRNMEVSITNFSPFQYTPYIIKTSLNRRN